MPRKRKGRDIHGWLILDKPQGLTSNAALGRVKRLLQPKKAGHAGTLDPLATGILPIAFGEATKTVAFAMAGAKTYRFAIKWGESTNTLDSEGEIVARSDVRPAESEIDAVLGGFIGEVEQIPPQYSAIKVDGERAYDLARAGEVVELEPRIVRIDALRRVDPPSEAGEDSLTGPDFTWFEMVCGQGAYVRAVVRDLAQALHAEGHVAALRRTRVGVFSLEDAITLEELEDLVHKDAALGRLAPLETALDDIPALAVSGQDASLLRQGRAIVLLPQQAQELRERRRPRFVGGEDVSRLALAMNAGSAIALGDVRAGRFQPVRVFQH
ncbi:MAG: tRNA pseudouridine(55) synthase TruB [Maricaulaceae bacterium]|jgi:tRNA pseudouridine55 synthase